MAAPPPLDPRLSPPGSAVSDGEELFACSGAFTEEAVVAHGRVLRALPGLSENARHRLFAVFVELAQNIARYSAERAGPAGGERGVGEFTLAAAPDGRLLARAANTVAPELAERLARSLGELAPLDAAALKALHRDRRRAPPPPGSLGAGLGLIELARHAAAPLVHVAEPRPDGLVRFTLGVPLSPL